MSFLQEENPVINNAAKAKMSNVFFMIRLNCLVNNNSLAPQKYKISLEEQRKRKLFQFQEAAKQIPIFAGDLKGQGP